VRPDAASNSMSPSTAESDRDFARLEIATPWTPETLRPFVDDVERLLRINPLVVFDRFEREGEDRWHLTGRNLANGRTFDLHMERVPLPDGGWRLLWKGGLKQATELRIRAAPDGTALLEIVDDYSGVPEAERKARKQEVDTSFLPWGRALHKYLNHWKRWSWIPGWKWYFGGPWLRMTPSARRIVFMLIFITAAEFVLFLFVLLIFKLEGV